MNYNYPTLNDQAFSKWPEGLDDSQNDQRYRIHSTTGDRWIVRARDLPALKQELTRRVFNRVSKVQIRIRKDEWIEVDRDLLKEHRILKGDTL